MINLLFKLGDVLMYKMQFCNALTQEVLREVTYDNAAIITSLIESAEKNVGNGLDSFIIDNVEVYKVRS